VPVVYDSVGKDTFTGSLDCCSCAIDGELRKLLGAVPPFELGVLGRRARSTSRADSGHPHRQARRSRGDREGLFDVVLSGKVKIEVNHVIRSRMRHRRSATRSAQDDRMTILIP